MFKRAKYVLQFWRRDDLQNTGFDPAIVELSEAAGSKVEGSIAYNY